MLVCLEWLLELCPAGADVDSVAGALTRRGLTVDSVEPRGADHVLDIDVPANRPDCLGHLGIARELSAALGVPLASVSTRIETSGAPAEQEARVSIDDESLCSRYTAGVVRDVRIGPSPDWVVKRLEACGMRSVNNAVDVSNLVMLELGQPVHFFDLDRLGVDGEGRSTIHVRAARPEETLRTLDGVDRRLEPEMAVIADPDRAVALAGVMGGAETEVSPATRTVLVEAAAFAPASIRATSRKLGLRSDASFRFERGGDPAGPALAQDLSARLLAQLAGGKPAPGRVDAYPSPHRPGRLTLRCPQLGRLLGFQPTGAEAREALERLQLAPEKLPDDTLRVTVPSWRHDLSREADLVEEVARHLGYDRIPDETEVSAAAARREPVEPSLEDRGRDLLAQLGFHEALGYSMIDAGEDDPFLGDGAPDALRLQNPIAEHLARLRRSILPGLVRAVDLNLRRGNRDVRLFEVGRVFLPGSGDAFPVEAARLGLAWCGGAEPRHWSRAERDVDLFDLIGVAEHVLEGLRPGSERRRAAGAASRFHPGRSAHWCRPDGIQLAWGGAAHPQMRSRLGEDVFFLEVDLDALAGAPARPLRFSELPRVPGVTRDLALVLTPQVTFGRVVDTLRTVEAPAPVRFEAIDRYEGPPLSPGASSVTVRVVLQPLEQTLTDAQTEGYRRSLVEALESALAVRIRS